MPSLVTPQGSVHYEVFGKGKPVLLLHGWLGSWGLWESTMESLSDGYRAYAIDFWGFGESGKRRDSYAVNDFVALLGAFMSSLGIAKAPLVGHSMGGTVSLMTAARFPEKITKVAVIGSPIEGNSLAYPLKLAGKPFIANLLFNQMRLFRWALRAASPILCDHPDFPTIIENDLSQTTLESFFKSIASLREIDLTDQLSDLNIPVLGMYGSKDNIVDPDQWRALTRAYPNSASKVYPGQKHFLMLSTGTSFQQDLRAFLDEQVTINGEQP